jgi:CRISPR-associated exonuclease Cas4
VETDDYLPLSGLQHLSFCERQCALIHVERIWLDNGLTVEGNTLHQRANAPGVDVRDGVRVVRALPLRSDRLKLVGKADAVEFHAQAVVPVEYKRGFRRSFGDDEIQVCAQAICLEEMLGIAVTEGAIFYGKSRRRVVVRVDDALRDRTTALAARFHAMVRARELPSAILDARCGRCSLREACMPRTKGSGRAYLASLAGSRL